MYSLWELKSSCHTLSIYLSFSDLSLRVNSVFNFSIIFANQNVLVFHHTSFFCNDYGKKISHLTLRSVRTIKSGNWTTYFLILCRRQYCAGQLHLVWQRHVGETKWSVLNLWKKGLNIYWNHDVRTTTENPETRKFQKKGVVIITKYF